MPNSTLRRANFYTSVSINRSMTTALTSPGYFHGELSTKDFGLAYGIYSIPLGHAKRWSIQAMAATAVVDYVSGLETGHWNSGVGGGIGYAAKKSALADGGDFLLRYRRHTQ